MMTREELGACRRWARDRASSGNGRLVELGAFLGASTREIVEGADVAGGHALPLVVYDAFVTQDSMRRWIELPFADGESFRPLFDMYTREIAERIDVRAGLIPEGLPAARADELWAQNEQISLLFIDLAKTPGVSRTVSRVFFPRLSPGAIVLHQELKYALYPWLGLHCAEMAGSLEAVEDVPGWMVALRCVRPIEPSDGAGASDFRTMPVDTAIAAWDRAIDWWGQGATPAVAAHAGLQKIEHLRALGAWDEAGRAAEEAMTPDDQEFVDNIDSLIWAVEEQAAKEPRAKELLGCLLGRREALRRPRQGDLDVVLWEHVAKRCEAAGYSRVALAGGGRLCRELVLDRGWPSNSVRVACVIDENPSAIEGVQVVRPAEAPADIDAVVLCSRYAERSLERMIAAEKKYASTPVVRVYTRHADVEGVGA